MNLKQKDLKLAKKLEVEVNLMLDFPKESHGQEVQLVAPGNKLFWESDSHTVMFWKGYHARVPMKKLWEQMLQTLEGGFYVDDCKGCGYCDE